MCFLCLKLLRPVIFFETVSAREGIDDHAEQLAAALCCLGKGDWRRWWPLRLQKHPGTPLLFQAGVWEGGAACNRKGDGPEPTQESASRAVVFSLQTRDQEQRSLYSSLSAALVCFLFLISSWERPWAALLISCGRDEKVQKREAVISEKGLFTL